MNNRELLQTLNNATFALVMWTLYFRPNLWVEGNFAKKHSTPLDTDIEKWLGAKAANYRGFWEYVGISVEE